MHMYVLLVVILNFFSVGEGKTLTCWVGDEPGTDLHELTLSDQDHPGNLVCATRYLRYTDGRQPAEITWHLMPRLDVKPMEGCIQYDLQYEKDIWLIRDCFCYTDKCNAPESPGRSVYALEEPKTLTCAEGDSYHGFQLVTRPVKGEDGSFVHLACGTRTFTQFGDILYFMDDSNEPQEEGCRLMEKGQGRFEYQLCICLTDKCNVPASPADSFYNKYYNYK